jgi:hypothetical protein
VSVKFPNEHASDLGKSEVLEPQIDPDELGDDRQGIEQKEVDDAERAPELAKTLEDQPRVADAGHRAQPYDHFLIDVQHWDQQHQRPQEGVAVVLPRLAIGAERAGIIVAGHDD